MSNPSYFSIITAAVRYDKSLCPNAKLLYSEITALTQKEGYCWASNKYFAELYDVDVSTVKRWVSSLEKGGHIEIVTKKQGMGWNRKIYAKNVYEGSKRSLPKAQKEAFRGLENEPIITQDTNNKTKEREGVPPSNPPSAPRNVSSTKIERAQHVSTTDEEHQKLAEAPHSPALRDAAYQVLSDWKEDTPRGKWKKSDFRSIKRWVFNAIDEKDGKGTRKKSASNTCLTDEARSQYDGAF